MIHHLCLSSPSKSLIILIHVILENNFKYKSLSSIMRFQNTCSLRTLMNQINIPNGYFYNFYICICVLCIAVVIINDTRLFTITDILIFYLYYIYIYIIYISYTYDIYIYMYIHIYLSIYLSTYLSIHMYIKT